MLSEAWKLEPSAYVANTRFRASLIEGDQKEALLWAREAAEQDPTSRASWASLAAAAPANGDKDLFRKALTHLESLPPATDSDPEARRWPLFAAGRVLAEAGRTDDAQGIVDVLRQLGETGLADRLGDLLNTSHRFGAPQPDGR